MTSSDPMARAPADPRPRLTARAASDPRTEPTPYDSLADVYDRFWGSFSVDHLLPALDRLVLSRLPRAARVLDLCCGSGQLAAALTGRGFAVVGLDSSSALLEAARSRAPEADLRLADARRFSLERPVDAVLSTFDSLNHVMSLDELAHVFGCVSTALEPEGWFAFDLNVEEGYRNRDGDSVGFVDDDVVCVARSRYEAEDRINRFDITVLRNGDGWRRSDVSVLQRCHEPRRIVAALGEAGFSEVQALDAASDLGVEAGACRLLVVARRMRL